VKFCVVGPSGKRIFDRDTRWTVARVDALTNDTLIHDAPAIVGRRTQSALGHGIA
jgi:hypothetical protein